MVFTLTYMQLLSFRLGLCYILYIILNKLVTPKMIKWQENKPTRFIMFYLITNDAACFGQNIKYRVYCVGLFFCYRPYRSTLLYYRVMRLVRHVARILERRNIHRILVRKLKKNLEDLSLEWMTILKWFLKKQVVSVLTGCVWLRKVGCVL